MELSVHPAADAFPRLTQQRLSELAQDIEANGLIHPIVLCDGKILDGRNRYAACQSVHVEPRFIDFDGDPWAYVWSANGQRRDLVDEQRVLIHMLCEQGSAQWEAARAAVAAEANRKRSEAAKGNRNASKDAKTAEPHREARLFSRNHADKSNKASSAKAQAAGVSRSTVERAEALANARPDLADKVRLGDMKPAEAHRLAKKDAVTAKVGALPDGTYRVIYADPPWSYNDKQAVKGAFGTGTGAAEGHYPSMSLSELRALPVSALAQPDAVLFLWVTSPLLPDGLDLMNSWGFKYKAAFIWDKVKHNMGHYNSVRHELLLIGTRGSCVPDQQKLFDSVQVIERAGHSEKPEEFRSIIDTLYTQGRRIELFRRGMTPEGWSAWGNETR